MVRKVSQAKVEKETTPVVEEEPTIEDVVEEPVVEEVVVEKQAPVSNYIVPILFKREPVNKDVPVATSQFCK